MKPNPAVDLNGLRFPHPVLAASGCLATGHDVPALVELHKLGGVVTRSLTFGASKGWPTPRSAETSSGLLSAVGLQNPGVLDFIDRDLPRLAKVGVPVVASVAGSSLGEYVDVTSAMHLKHGVVAIEVCLSSADDEREGDPFYASPERLVEIVGAVARMARVPVFAKLPPLLPGLVEVAQQCVRAGAFGFTLVDAIPALAVDASRLRTRTATPVGGLSGPAVKPIALAAVYQCYRATGLPIVGMGGIATGRDALEFLAAGASSIALGTVLFSDPDAPGRVRRELAHELEERGLSAAEDATGLAHGSRPATVA